MSRPDADLATLKAAHDALVAFHRLTADAMARNVRRVHAEREALRVTVTTVALAMPKADPPPLGGMLSLAERASWEEGWDAALTFASEFVLDALRAQQ